MNELTQQFVRAYLKNQGLTTLFTSSQLSGGANNRVYKIQAGDRSFVLKEYFRNPGDSRDRRLTEYDFIQHCDALTGIRTPKLLATSAELGISLIEFIDGQSFDENVVLGSSEVDQAIKFFHSIQSDKSGSVLGVASEACWGINGHLKRAERRIRLLDSITTESEINSEVLQFIRTELNPYWHSKNEECLRSALAKYEDPKAQDRVISPSDFGFHNAISTTHRGVMFIDFEYAGWDDPAKTILDFFLQPKIKVPRKYFEWFRDEVLQHTHNAALHRERIELLTPIYKVIWICMLLNEFLPGSASRREFALGADELIQLKVKQLLKAEALLNSAD